MFNCLADVTYLLVPHAEVQVQCPLQLKAGICLGLILQIQQLLVADDGLMGLS